jgi:hypothetical protein
VLGLDGMLYVGGRSLFSLNSAGEFRWTARKTCEPGGLPCGFSPRGCPAVGSDGLLYTFAGDELLAISQSGETVLQVAARDFGRSSPVIAADGTIHLSAGTARNSDGSHKWFADSDANGQATIGADGTVYGINNQTLWAVQ